MRKILFLITALENGGAENQTVQLCCKLADKGYHVELVSMLKPKQYQDDLNNAGVTIHSLGMSKGVADPRAIFRLRRCIRSFRPDVVHSHMVHANLLARAVRLTTRIPRLICTAHNMNEGGRIREWMYRLTDPLCDLTTNVSKAAVQRYIEVKAASPNKILHMPNGINLHKFMSDPPFGPNDRTELYREFGLTDEFVWLAVGRFVPEKDYPTMLAAFAKVLENGTPAVLLIVGDGLEREAAMRMCHSLQIERHVRFLGIRHDIPRLMNCADSFLMSSQWEGLPMVLLEAAASALPIVTTSVGGNPEIVLDGINGYLSPPSDSEHLGRMMEKMMGLSPLDRHIMGEHGREHVTGRYDMDQVVEQWELLYSEGYGHD